MTALVFIDLIRGPYRTGQYSVALHVSCKLRDRTDDMGRWPSACVTAYAIADDFGDLVLVTGWR
ncbi:MAG: hypothetical protein LBQ32_06280 [Burkholderiaceae bacterium]|jgi:hypothetical protein|nr:hypothetical protein [Burkholderiaceae bacterium]